MSLRLARSGLVAAAVLLSATGCVNEPSPYSDLNGPPARDRPLPEALPVSALEPFDVDTIRWVGSYKGTEIWLGKGLQAPACLVAYLNEQQWIAGCGATLSGSDGRAYSIIPDGGAGPEGATAVSVNVYATGD